MMRFILLLVVITYVVAFRASSSTFRASRSSINMIKGKSKGVKKETPADANYTRKLKRAIRASDATTFTTAVLTSKTENFLKEQGPGRLYDNLLHLIKQQASKLKVTVDKEYGALPKVVLPDIVQIASGDESFKTLVSAVTAAGLASTLKGAGPFTVFAPTDEAFAKLPEGTLEGLLADKEKLANILKYHVVSGWVTSKKAGALEKAASLQGAELAIKVDKKGAVTINSSNVVKADIKGQNGFIHVIDAVLIPPEAAN